MIEINYSMTGRYDGNRLQDNRWTYLEQDAG